MQISPELLNSLLSQALGTGILGGLVWMWANRVTKDLVEIKKDIHAIRVSEAKNGGEVEGEIKRLWDQINNSKDRLARMEASDAQLWKKVDRARGKISELEET